MGANLQRVDELTSPPVIGERYLVPCVRFPWLSQNDERPGWWPVIGPRHDDQKHLGFKPEHFHVDGRFLTERQWRSAESFGRINYMFALNVCASMVVSAVPLNRTSLSEQMAELVPEYRPLKCQRYPLHTTPYSDPGSRFVKFWRLFSGRPCSRSEGILICPHKGAPLSGIAPDADGNITCPLHGLRFTRDGKSVPRNIPVAA